MILDDNKYASVTAKIQELQDSIDVGLADARVAITALRKARGQVFELRTLLEESIQIVPVYPHKIPGPAHPTTCGHCGASPVFSEVYTDGIGRSGIAVCSRCKRPLRRD